MYEQSNEILNLLIIIIKITNYLQIGSNLTKGHLRKDEMKTDGKAGRNNDAETDFKSSGSPLEWVLQNAPDDVSDFFDYIK